MMQSVMFAFMLLLATLCVAPVPEELISFGVTTYSSPGDSAGEHTVTVWFLQKVYQCTITPSAAGTTYTCDAASSFIACDSNSGVDEAKILFDNEHIDASIFNNIFITTTFATYSITGVCIPDGEVSGLGGHYRGVRQTGSTSCGSGRTHFDMLCIDGESYSSGGSCWPPQQIAYFDLSQPDVGVDNAIWEDATAVAIPSSAECATEEEVIEFGITTFVSPGQSPGSHTITVSFYGKVYQCNVTPSSVETTYTCAASSSFIGCDPSFDGAKILFDNPHIDASILTEIFIRTNVATYSITGVCIPDGEVSGLGGHYRGSRASGLDTCDSGFTHFSEFCIDGEVYTSGGSCWPPQQVLYFDTTQPNVEDDNAIWANGASDGIAAVDCGCRVDGLGLTRNPHACECKAACVDTDAFCHPMGFILNLLDVSGVEGYCAGDLECCCSCPDCPGHTPL